MVVIVFMMVIALIGLSAITEDALKRLEDQDKVILNLQANIGILLNNNYDLKIENNSLRARMKKAREEVDV